MRLATLTPSQWPTDMSCYVLISSVVFYHLYNSFNVKCKLFHELALESFPSNVFIQFYLVILLVHIALISVCAFFFVANEQLYDFRLSAQLDDDHNNHQRIYTVKPDEK